MSPQARRALAAYAASAKLAQSPERIFYLLHDRMHQEIRSAIFAHEQRALGQMCRHTAKTTRILSALLVQLDFQRAGADGWRLRRLYLSLFQQLAHVMRDANVAESLQQCCEILQSLRDGADTEIQVSTLQQRG